ncbi:MAG: RHS repeat-associated protein [Halioglobus sp.]|jgi:RHS repeat-associated protein
MSHRYGFNGKEMDNGVKGEGVQYDYGFRIYDARIARFLSVDPLTASYPWYTPYQFAGNMPILAVDVDGLEPGLGMALANMVGKDPELKNMDYGEVADRFYTQQQIHIGLTGLAIVVSGGAVAYYGIGGGLAFSGTSLTFSIAIEGAASYATGSKFDFFDAGVGAFGVGLYMLTSPQIDITSNDITFGYEKEHLQLASEYLANFAGYKLGKFVNIKSDKYFKSAKHFARKSEGAFVYAGLLGKYGNKNVINTLKTRSIINKAFEYQTIANVDKFIGNMLLNGGITFKDLLFTSVSKHAASAYIESNENETCEEEETCID